MKLFSLLVLISTYVTCGQCSISASRLFVIDNRIGKQYVTLAFRTAMAKPGTDALEVSYRDSQSTDGVWTAWASLGAPESASLSSNPVGEYNERNQTQVFVQASDGQVYTISQDPSNFMNFGSWSRVGTNKLPSGTSKIAGADSVTVGQYGKDMLVFARSLTNTSQLYWCKGNSSGFGAWSVLGGKTILGTDATLIKNEWNGLYEAYMITSDGTLHRTWQHNENSFADWRTMGIDVPKFITTSRPAAHLMGYNIYNGKVMVGGIGTDGYVHRIWQTTCDTVDNPWGYCTWGLWYKTAEKIPFSYRGENNLAMSRNIHFGVEMFTMNATGQLWQAWQLDRGASWHGWNLIPQEGTQSTITTLPFITTSADGWWIMYAVNATNHIVTVEPPRSINVTPDKIPFGTNATISWSVPVDEATHEDWVAIYPDGAGNSQYVDYRYVQGKLNPMKDPIPAGNVTFASYLPDGSYNVRYLVNQKYLSVLNKTVSYFNESQEPEYLQLYRGLFMGLGAKNKGIEQCVDEGTETIEKFQAAFDAFENREVYKGLELLGTALEDVAKTLEKCQETTIAQDMEKFIKDLIACTEDNCTSFLIDIVDELVIFYEDAYEIYGDILGASNNFNLIKAYQQGGLCVGRMVQACISLPADINDVTLI